VPEPSHPRKPHRRHARLFIAAAFLLQRCGDGLVIWYTFLRENPTFLLRGLAIGSSIWTTTLIIGVWRRRRWARYVLTTVNWCTIAIFAYTLLHWWDRLESAASGPACVLAGGVMAYVGANVILIRSRRVRHYACD
jgi:hypothetical protein